MKFFHSGDLGDVIYALPSMREMGGGEVYLNSRPWTAAMTSERAGVLRPLLEAQPYVGRVTHGDAPPGSVDFSTFRRGGLLYGVSLGELQSRWVAAKATFSPWLSAAKSPESAGRIVCHRSPRYHNPYFRWDEIGKKFGGRLLLVGMPQEVEALRGQLGFGAEHAPTKDYLALASLIAGADLFIGNQSSPMALAIGLGVPFVQETCLWTPDCLYIRTGCHYCYDGGIPAYGIPSFDPPPDIDRLMTPPGGWTAASPQTGEADSFKFHRRATRWLFAQGGFATEDEAAREVDRQNARRVPFLVRRDSGHEIFRKVREAVDSINNRATF